MRIDFQKGACEPVASCRRGAIQGLTDLGTKIVKGSWVFH